MRLSHRKETILKLIVEEFIKNATPVGSSTLIKEYNLSYSSATIRNEMAELEEEGYLEKTHTSSGRVPSSLGYRYYVDNLRDEEESEYKNQIQSIFDVNKNLSINEAIQKSVEIISQLTNLTSVVLGPEASKEKINKIQVIQVDENTAVAVFVTDTGHVENKTFLLPEDTTFEDLETSINIINDRIKGTPINKVIEKVDALKPLISEKVKNFELIFRAFVQAFVKFTYDRGMNVYGRNKVLEHKELTNDIDKLKKFVHMLEDSEIWKKFENAEGIKVSIGNENDDLDMDDVSVVSAEIKISPDQKGTIALVGPTRMDYKKAISAIEYLQEQIAKYFEEEGDDN